MTDLWILWSKQVETGQDCPRVIKSLKKSESGSGDPRSRSRVSQLGYKVSQFLNARDRISLTLPNQGKRHLDFLIGSITLRIWSVWSQLLRLLTKVGFGVA